MNLRHLFCLSSLLLASTMGCCHSRCVSSDPCDPCGCMPTGGRYFSGWMNNKIDSWRMQNYGRNYGWNAVGCGCNACGTGIDGEMMSSGCASGNCGGSMMSSDSPAGCACGQQHSEYAPSVPGTMVPSAAPAVAPTPLPVPPVGNEPAPAPASSDINSTAIPRTLATQPQQVSVEEFHRLPGVITSGPTSQSSVPSVAASASSAQPVMAAPQLSSVPTPPRVSSGAQQVNWLPTKQ